MKLDRLFTVVLLIAMIFVSVAAEAAPHRDKRDRRPPDGLRPQISEETRKLAAACRRDPSEENRDALRKQIGIDYDRFLEEQRAKLKKGKRDRKSQEMSRRLDAMKRDRDKYIERIMERMLDPQGGRGSRDRRSRD